jgi:hypothetical protein
MERIVYGLRARAVHHRAQAGEQPPRSSSEQSYPKSDRQMYVILVEENAEQADQR